MHYINLVRCLVSVFFVMVLASCANSVEEIEEIKDLTYESSGINSFDSRIGESKISTGTFVSTTYPSANSTNIDVNASRIIINFNRKMKIWKVIRGFSISPFVEGAVIKKSRYQIVYELSEKFTGQTNYTVNISGASDSEGNALDDFSLEFMTGNSPDDIASGELSDTIPPTTPGNLRAATEPSSSAVELTWDAATDNVAVVGYRVMRGNTVVSITTSTTYTDNSVLPESLYPYAVFAFDAAYNNTISNIIFVNTPATPDITAPSIPVNLRTVTGSLTSSSVQLLWDSSTDNIAVTGYRVMRDNTIITSTTSTEFTDTNISPGAAYQYSVVAFDEANNESSSDMLLVNTLNDTSGIATLSWNPPTENIDNSLLTDLNGYKIYYGLSADALNNAITISNIGVDSYVIENLNVNTTYYFSITAVNAFNSESDLSNIVSKYISG